MYICKKCGKSINPDYGFCKYCGTAVAIPGSSDPFNIPVYKGRKREFHFRGETIIFTPDMDLANFYLKQFHKLSDYQLAAFIDDYKREITDIEKFVSHFPTIFVKHIYPLYKACIKLLAKMKIYDITLDVMDEDYSQNSHSVKFYEKILSIVEEAIEENVERKIQHYENMPQLFFSGGLGIAAAFAYNAAINKIAERDISNAELSKEDRKEMNDSLKESQNDIFNMVSIDYCNVSLYLLGVLSNTGDLVWCPTEQNDKRRNRLSQNIVDGCIPESDIPSQIVRIMQLNPFIEDKNLRRFLKNKYPGDETNKLLKYLPF